MKNIRSKIGLVVVAMLLTAVNDVCAFTIDGLCYEVLSEDDKTVSVFGPERVDDECVSGHLSIPSTVMYDGNTYAVVKIGFDAFEGCTSLTSVTIPNTVIEISRGPFQRSGLTSVTIGSSVAKIDSFAFFECIGLTSVDIPESVTSIDTRAFNGCI